MPCSAWVRTIVLSSLVLGNCAATSMRLESPPMTIDDVEWQIRHEIFPGMPRLDAERALHSHQYRFRFVLGADFKTEDPFRVLSPSPQGAIGALIGSTGTIEIKKSEGFNFELSLDFGIFIDKDDKVVKVNIKPFTVGP